MTDNRPLRVGLVYDDSLDRHGGVGQYCCTLAAALQRRGHHVTFLVGESSTETRRGAQVHSLARNVAVDFNGNRLTTPVLASRRQLRRVVEEEEFDVVHVQVPYSPLLAGRVIGAVPSGTAVVGTCHVYSERRLVRLGARALGAVCARTLARFDEVVAVSDPAASFARRFLAADVRRIVPNMVDIPSAPGWPDKRGSGPSVVFVGSLVPRKGVDALIEAFALLRRELPAVTLTIAGDGPLRSRLERSASAIPGARLVGSVSEVEKARLLAGADVACFPSRFGESFGIVLLEAMAASGPLVLGGANAGHRAVLGYEDVLVDPGDPASLARTLARAITDRLWRRDVSARQREIVVRYEADRVCDEILRVYARALARRRPHAHAAALAHA